MCVKHLYLTEDRVSEQHTGRRFTDEPIAGQDVNRGAVQGVWVYSDRKYREPSEHYESRTKGAATYFVSDRTLSKKSSHGLACRRT